MTQKVKADKIVRCIAVALADNESGRFLGSNLISNILDLDKAHAFSLFMETKALLLSHKRGDGSLKDFENGKFTFRGILP